MTFKTYCQISINQSIAAVISDYSDRLIYYPKLIN